MGNISCVRNGGASTSVPPTEAELAHNAVRERVRNQVHSFSPRLRRPTYELIFRRWRLNSSSAVTHMVGAERKLKRPPTLILTSLWLTSITARIFG